MNHRSPSRTRSHTPTCPEDPDEKDVHRRTISQIQKDVERELENADRVLSQVDSFTGSRSQSRTGNVRQRGDSGRKDGVFDGADGYMASEQRRASAGPHNRAKPEECSRSTAHSVADISGHGNRGADYDTQDRAYESRGGPQGQYSGHEGTGAPESDYGGPGGPYRGPVTPGGGYGGPGTPGGGYGGPGTPGGGYGGPGAPGGGYGGPGAPGGGYGGPGTPGGGYGGPGTPGGGYGGPVTPGGGYGGPGTPGGGYGGPGAPGGGYGGPGAPGGGYGGPGTPGGGYGGPGAPGGGYGGPGTPGGGYGGPGTPGGGYGGPGTPGGGYGGPGTPGAGHPYGVPGAVGSGYGGPDDPYGGTGGTGMGHSPLEAYPHDGDPYAVPKSPGTGPRTRDPSKIGHDQGKTPPGMPFDTASPAAYDSRGKSPPSVHYSPSTALSPRAGNSPRMQGSGLASEARSGLVGDRSPGGTQFSASRAPSRAGLDSSGYDRSKSPTGTQYSGSKGVPDIMGVGSDGMGFEGPGSRLSPTGGSRGSPGRSARGGSFTDGSKGTFCSGAKDQSVTNNKICPAALQGKCPAFARDSSPMEPSRASSVATSGSKRPLSRIEEGAPSEEMGDKEPSYGQVSCLPEEDFKSPSGGSPCGMQHAKEGFSTCPPQIPQRPRCEASGQSMYDSMVSDRFQSIAPRPQAIGFAQPPVPSRVPVSTYEHHHDHHDHHNGEGMHVKPIHIRDERATSALNHLSQIQKTPSYLRCKPDRGLDFSSCDKSGKEAPKMVKFPEKPCKGMDELQEMIQCESQDVDSVWYLTSDEKKTYKKPCPKQQKAQENVKSIVKPQTPQTCPKEYSPLEHPDPDDITPELAASMMFSQEQGIKLTECPDQTIKRFFPDIPRPPFPVKLSGVHIIDPNQEDQEEMIEKSASVPSEGVSDSAYTRTMQNKGEEMGAQKSYDIDFAVGAEKREYVLVAEKPQRYNKVQFRGNLPSWFPGYMQAFPEDNNGMKLVASPSELFQKAWTNTNPEKIPSSDMVVLE